MESTLVEEKQVEGTWFAIVHDSRNVLDRRPSRIPEDFAQGLNEPQCREEKDGVIYSTLVVSQSLVVQTRMFLVIRILPRLFNARLLVFRSWCDALSH